MRKKRIGGTGMLKEPVFFHSSGKSARDRSCLASPTAAAGRRKLPGRRQTCPQSSTASQPVLSVARGNRLKLFFLWSLQKNCQFRPKLEAEWCPPIIRNSANKKKAALIVDLRVFPSPADLSQDVGRVLEHQGLSQVRRRLDRQVGEP
jgi:hypothetical protein